MNSDTDQAQILITGGTGFIGVPLCQALQARGGRLSVLTRNPHKATERLGREIRPVKALSELPDIQFDVLINLAGEPLATKRWTNSRKEEIRRSRIGTTEALLEHFQQTNQYPKVMISGSAIGYYGDRGDEPLTETDGPGTGFGAQMCRDWEAMAERFADHGVRVCRLRTGIVLGPGGGVLKTMLLPFKLGLGGPLGSGRQYMSWVHREDLIRLILYCIDNPALTGPVNGTAPNPVTNKTFTRTLAKTLHRPAIFPAPAIALRLVFADLADELMLASQRVLPEVAVNNGFTFLYPELGPALDDVIHNS